MTLTVWYKERPDSIYENVTQVTTLPRDRVQVNYIEEPWGRRATIIELDANTRVELMAD